MAGVRNTEESMRTIVRAAVLMLGLAGLALCGAACEAMGRASSSPIRSRDTGPSLELVPTRTTIYAGETVVIVAKTANTLGRDARIEWFPPAFGEIQTEDDGTRATLRVDRPGKVTVKANLIMGAQIISDLVTIEVKPLS